MVYPRLILHYQQEEPWLNNNTYKASPQYIIQIVDCLAPLVPDISTKNLRNTMVRVQVNDVRSSQSLKYLIEGKTQSMHLNPSTVYNMRFVPLPCDVTNGLIGAVHMAFAHHMPLEICPDAIYNTILQSISTFMSIHKSPSKQKKNLTVVNNNNNWKQVIEGFKKEIMDDMYGTSVYKLLQLEFSTTTETHKIAHVLAFMELVQDYYDYTVVTCCGIPYIEILGTKKDWITISETIEPFLKEISLTKWNDELQYILLYFIRAFDGDIDQRFWNGIYKYNAPAGSGTVSNISGWIGKFSFILKQVPIRRLNRLGYMFPSIIFQ